MMSKRYFGASIAVVRVLAAQFLEIHARDNHSAFIFILFSHIIVLMPSMDDMYNIKNTKSLQQTHFTHKLM